MDDLNQQLTEILKASVVDAFQATIGLKPEITEDSILSDDACIISSIGFTGTLDGSCSICLSYASAQKIVSRMLQIDIEDMNEDVIDGISEQINMIIGGMKMKLVETDHTFEISIPTTIKGNRMVILSDFSHTTMITINYSFDDIQFSVSFLYKIHKDKEQEALEKQKARAEAMAKLSQLVDGD